MSRIPWGGRLRLRASVACCAASGAVALVGPAVGVAHAQDPVARGYEAVLPADRDYSFGQPGSSVAVASPDGSSVAYATIGALPGSEAGSLQNYYVGRRGLASWATTPLAPPINVIPGGVTYPRTSGFSTDLSRIFFATAEPRLTSDAVPDLPQLYFRDSRTGSYELLSKGLDPATATGNTAQEVYFAGASDDGRHIVFESLVPLGSITQTPANSGVYEWVDGVVRYVGILPDGTPAGMTYVGDQAKSQRQVQHAVSRDGRRIVFFAPDGGGGVYLREDAATTTKVSATQRTTPDPLQSEPTYQGADADVTKIFFTSAEQLTDDAFTGDDGAGNQTYGGSDLYRYDVASGKLTDLTVGLDPADSFTGAAVQGVVGVSDDGEYVYFVATGNLAPGATSGSPNLYLRHGDDVRFIGTLDWGDGQVWSRIVADASTGRTSRISPDGRFLTFPSLAPLTGYDNTDPDTATPYNEIFRYSADDDQLICVSCKADGPARGNSTIAPPDFVTNITRNLSVDGRRVFFDSADALVPGDVNGQPDAYEYADGGLRLLSSGKSRYPGAFEDASATGDDVFISTRAQLAPQDTDDLVDLYDARVGGGFPLAPPDGCSGSTCGSGGTGNADHPADVPGSVTLNGPGNVVSKRVVRAAFTFKKLTKAQRRNAARTGRLSLSVSVNTAGTVKAQLRGKVGKRTMTVGSAKRTARGSGTVRLSLRLNAAARRALSHRRTLKLRLTVTYSKVSTAKRTTVSLHR